MTARIERPLSPHLQTYRWTLTMALSIVHRATGIALYFGTLLLAWWLIAAATGPGAYANVQAFTSSFIGRLIVFAYTWALLHHLCSGIRHFVWDLGYGFKANEREALTWGALIAGISLTVLLWIVAYMIGGGRGAHKTLPPPSRLPPRRCGRRLRACAISALRIPARRTSGVSASPQLRWCF
jgi:succinate dehydrogenase / fumarate reductase cytochrome b subunit